MLVSEGIPSMRFHVMPPSSERKSPCVQTFDKQVHPQRILLGETVDVTLTTSAICTGERVPLHIVLVLDGSKAMVPAVIL